MIGSVHSHFVLTYFVVHKKISFTRYVFSTFKMGANVKTMFTRIFQHSINSSSSSWPDIEFVSVFFFAELLTSRYEKYYPHTFNASKTTCKHKVEKLIENMKLSFFFSSNENECFSLNTMKKFVERFIHLKWKYEREINSCVWY